MSVKQGRTGRLAGKVALVTGGSSGIGLATAQRFAQEGAIVYITGRRQDALDEAVLAIGAAATGVAGDASDMADLDHLFARIGREQDRLDVIFVNAGGGHVMPLADVTEEFFDREFAANAKGAFFTVQKALPLLADGTSIILNASVTASKGIGGFSVYSAAKAALRSFARSWTTDLKARRIRVNAVSPGMIMTPAYDAIFGDGVQAYVDSVTPLVPLGRVGVGDDIAGAVLFLASDESSYVTGIELTVDGGWNQV